VERIFGLIRLGRVDLVSSEVLEDEARRAPIPERRLEAESLLSLASSAVEIDGPIAQRARDLAALGYGAFDALHLAAAESAGADFLLSTDDRFIRRAERGLGSPRIPVRNPVSWIQEQRL
jgi:predicted nucleic acid-binding protein